MLSRFFPVVFAMQALLAASDCIPNHVPRPERIHRVAVLMHIAPRSAGSAVLAEGDVAMLFETLLAISQQPSVRVESVCMFSLDSRQVLARKTVSEKLDVTRLREGTRSLRLGLVSYDDLKAGPLGTLNFLNGLIAEALDSGPAAVVVLGAETQNTDRPGKRALTALRFDRPIFYLHHVPPIEFFPWRDLINNLIHAQKGGVYDLRRQSDFRRIWPAIEARLDAAD